VSVANDLFDESKSVEPQRDRRLLKDADGRKIVLVGFTHGRTCKECDHFYRVQYAKVYRRCELYPKKNWKANFEACSKFVESPMRQGKPKIS